MQKMESGIYKKIFKSTDPSKKRLYKAVSQRINDI